MHKVLIANRGEIALRIIRTCQQRGIKTVAIYSEADQDLPFVHAADEAVCIGPPPVAKSYLQMDTILRVAQKTGADAIHPGYGLLSENHIFAEKVKHSGYNWIGPEPQVIADMGDKVTARRVMMGAGIPVVPGTDGLDSIEEAKLAAEQMGYPIMIKASAGGGGIGMHVCHQVDELEKVFPSAQARAKAYFGNDTLFMEKWIESSRHIEVQIVADSAGKVLHLFERECSIQRRNQKVIEESLSPSIKEQTRQRLLATAVEAAQAVMYTGAGTIEFLVDEEENFYFLEMNTRLQVEHPVTECITGLDLVDLQLDLAEGKPLPFSQAEITPKGHAMEFRVYAEDPQTMMPSPGLVTSFEPPTGDGVRIDAGVKAGNQVSPFYDPMIAKCIVSGSNRAECLAKSREALHSFKIGGIKTNIPLLLEICDHPFFIEGKYDTQLIHKIKR
ncbi:acetyl-CoA carboxylase biotin carboxylase subunit [Hazenella coriacea]|uniref:acetyl-CoA carboxylase biotin carboxylase subunit n=1 Tax=Hazenella coriacea TaxID=1179467 RepID=UPI001051B1A1|nr:acetyl-CoA carboxylase biotin carboxylase subunit [Hazenella coriacea]